MARAGCCTQLADDAQRQVFGGYAGGKLALDADIHGFGPLLQQALGCQDVFDLAGADAEG